MLQAIQRVADNSWVVAGRKPDTHLKSLDVGWRALRARARLEDVRMHDLRHSYALRALVLGESPTDDREAPGAQSSRDYSAHLANDSVHACAERISKSLAVCNSATTTRGFCAPPALTTIPAGRPRQAVTANLQSM